MISESTAFKTAIFDALCACLGLDKNSSAAAALIHEAYDEPENAPQPPRIRDIIYWYTMLDPTIESSTRHYETEARTGGMQRPKVYTTLKYQLVIICYGPTSEEYAMRIRSFLFLDGAGFPRRILRDADIYPIPDPDQPAVLYEEEDSLWRKRADLTVSLRVVHEQNAQTRNAITTAPAVIIRR